MTRDSVLMKACEDCLKELYSFVQPSVKWEDFVLNCELYNKCYKEWGAYNDAYYTREDNPKTWQEFKKSYEKLDWEGKNITECIGPRPYEFYYLPKEIMKDICDSYVHAYRLDQQQELLDTIKTLKNYCKEPIIDKYIDDWTDETGFHHPGYRSYDHPDNLEKEIKSYLEDTYDVSLENSGIEDICDIFYKFLDMAGNFYNWNRDLNTFNVSVYLGPSPNSSKEAVIENWKKYRNKDIEINEEQIKKDYYGEDELD